MRCAAVFLIVMNHQAMSHHAVNNHVMNNYVMNNYVMRLDRKSCRASKYRLMAFDGR